LFYFHLADDTVTLDRNGLDLPDIASARAVAAERIAEILREGDVGTLWDGKPLRLWVIDEPKSAGRKLFSLNVTATSDERLDSPSTHGRTSSPVRILPKYFFLLRWPYREEADREGTILLHDDEAHAYAKRIIRELKEAGGYDDPGLTMIVRNACGETLFLIPFVEVR
jgi:hypothetical protein